LQAAVKLRISSEGRKFTNQYELGAFLQNHISKAGSKTVMMGRLDILFEVLKVMELDSPRNLEHKLENWDWQKSTDDSIDLPLMDHVFSVYQIDQKPKLSRLMNKAKPKTYQSRRQILLNAIQIYDGLCRTRKGKRRSIRNLSDFDPKMVRFHQLYSVLEGGKSAEDSTYQTTVDELWSWFEGNVDMTARVSLGLAFLEKPLITDRLKTYKEEYEEDDVPRPRSDLPRQTSRSGPIDNYSRYSGPINHFGRHSNDWLFGRSRWWDIMREGIDRRLHHVNKKS
jgi:hypothetical protein